ncbi:MAG: sigma-70 family RNA polymerase sigma factor [Candidatus Eisenbacteria bacterium]|nr:sigma-70 family RNA polymerase sigma factor [Candidatus Eisenbacteria bacterium]
MNEGSRSDITVLLASARSGDAASERQLIELLYDQLRAAAGRLMRGERPDHTLQPTAVVHEAFLRIRPHLSDARDRNHLLAAIRRAMRNVLIDYARRHRAQKRQRPSLDSPRAPLGWDPWSLELLEALDELGGLDGRQLAVVQCRFFLGLTVEETAEHLRVSRSTVEKDWRLSRAWLRERLSAMDCSD